MGYRVCHQDWGGHAAFSLTVTEGLNDDIGEGESFLFCGVVLVPASKCLKL